MSVKVTKSSNFDRNLNAKVMVTQMRKNQRKANEILKETSNNIAPIDSGRLRSNVTSSYQGDKITTSWNQPYAKVRYYKNYKNPQTTRWIEKGIAKAKPTMDRIMTEDVVK